MLSAMHPDRDPPIIDLSIALKLLIVLLRFSSNFGISEKLEDGLFCSITLMVLKLKYLIIYGS